jgi:uncharacterized protein YcbX
VIFNSFFFASLVGVGRAGARDSAEAAQQVPVEISHSYCTTIIRQKSIRDQKAEGEAAR